MDYRVVTVTLDLGDSRRAGAGEAAREALSNFLWEAGALGVVDEVVAEAGDEAIVLRAFFPPGRDADDLATGVRAYATELTALGLAAPAQVVVDRLAPAPWGEAWRAHFRPLAVGRRLAVCPPWERPAEALTAGREILWIEPGRAFGTGGHATTRACLALLERALDRRPALRALDVGTGSGILAIAALRLGVAEAWAIDLDPDAATAARENAVRNGVAERLRVVITDLGGWRGPVADLVLANLLAATHVAHAALLARAVEPGGYLVLGGALVHEVPAVVGALAPHGLWLAEVAEQEGWAAMIVGRFP